MVLRYDSTKIVLTRLDPLNDFISWFAGLRSKGFVADLLREIHGFNDQDKLSKASKAISSHAENAVNLLIQGFSGLPDVSFLPIYYALLNIAKIQIILNGKQSELEQQRLHGVSYNSRSSRDLMTEEIKLHKKGAIPLYFHSITNQNLVQSERPISLKIREIYPFIRDISHEFLETYGVKYPFCTININLEGNDKDGYRLKADISESELLNFDKRHIKVLNGFNLLPKIRQTRKGQVINKTGNNYYITKLIKDPKEDAQRQLIKQYLRRYLLSLDVQPNYDHKTITPISNNKLILPEELPILLAFYHMSSVVRYNPEMLDQLRDSKAWTLLLALARHGTLSFLELSWSAIQKKHIKILPNLYGG